MHIAMVSLFPEMFAAIAEHGVTGRAMREGLASLTVVNPRDYTHDKHRTVDDRPYGGGPGMLMKIDPLRQAIDEAKARASVGESVPKVVYLSPQGARLDNAKARSLSTEAGLVLVCGRYEGVDERLVQTVIDEELSIGDYVLSGGELAAMVVVDAVLRHCPGVLGHQQSAAEDSFANGLLDCPHYTRPDVYEGMAVPEVLLSGDHERIRRWRLQQALGRTEERRPDLLAQRELSALEQELLASYRRETQTCKTSCEATQLKIGAKP